MWMVSLKYLRLLVVQMPCWDSGGCQEEGESDNRCGEIEQFNEKMLARRSINTEMHNKNLELLEEGTY